MHRRERLTVTTDHKNYCAIVAIYTRVMSTFRIKCETAAHCTEIAEGIEMLFTEMLMATIVVAVLIGFGVWGVKTLGQLVWQYKPKHD